MINSADEYKRWFDAPHSRERWRKLREPASIDTWLEVIERFPECRAEVAFNPDVPLAVLETLRQDEDNSVQWSVRRTRTWVDAHPDDGDPWRDDPDTLIQFRLSDDERAVLRAGLVDWGGPARCTEELAVAMGFASVDDLLKTGWRIATAIVAGEPLSRTDWVRALLATEIVFASNVVGSGWDWESTTGFRDEQTLHLLRSLQRRIVGAGVVGRAFGTRPSRG